jgi:hypothetical protein
MVTNKIIPSLSYAALSGLQPLSSHTSSENLPFSFSDLETNKPVKLPITFAA